MVRHSVLERQVLSGNFPLTYLVLFGTANDFLWTTFPLLLWPSRGLTNRGLTNFHNNISDQRLYNIVNYIRYIHTIQVWYAKWRNIWTTQENIEMNIDKTYKKLQSVTIRVTHIALLLSPFRRGRLLDLTGPIPLFFGITQTFSNSDSYSNC